MSILKNTSFPYNVFLQFWNAKDSTGTIRPTGSRLTDHNSINSQKSMGFAKCWENTENDFSSPMPISGRPTELGMEGEVLSYQ